MWLTTSARYGRGGPEISVGATCVFLEVECWEVESILIFTIAFGIVNSLDFFLNVIEKNLWIVWFLFDANEAWIQIEKISGATVLPRLCVSECRIGYSEVEAPVDTSLALEEYELLNRRGPVPICDGGCRFVKCQNQMAQQPPQKRVDWSWFSKELWKKTQNTLFTLL